MLEAPKEYDDILSEFLIRNGLEEITTDSRYMEVLLLLYKEDYNTAYIRYNELFAQEERDFYITTYLFGLRNGTQKILKQFWKQIKDEKAFLKVEEIEEHLGILDLKISLDEKNKQKENILASNLIEKIEEELSKFNGWDEDYQKLCLMKEN